MPPEIDFRAALSSEIAAAIEAAVSSGDRESTEAVVHEALLEWCERRRLRTEAIAELRQAWQDGIASGPGEPAATVMARLRAKYVAMNREDVV